MRRTPFLFTLLPACLALSLPAIAFAGGSISLTATLACANIELTWTVSPAGLPVSEYMVYEGTSPSDLAEIATTTKTSYTILKPTRGALYYFAVAGISDGTPLSGGAATASVPLYSMVLTGAILSPTSIELQWAVEPSCEPVSGFLVIRDNLVVTETRQRHYTMRDLTPDQSYSFLVKGGGLASNVLNLVTINAGRH